MSARATIKGLNMTSESFEKDWKKLPEEVKREAKKMVGHMLMTDQMPAKLHFHPLVGYDGIFTIHITPDDKYKASFTIDGDTAIFRQCGKHEEIDKNP